MGRYAITAAWATSQAAPDGAPGSLHWWLLVGGSAGTVITLVLSSALYRAFCRRGSTGLETSSFILGLIGPIGLFIAFVGALNIVPGPPSGPPADTSAFLLLLAATVGLGVILVRAFVVSHTSVPPRHDLGPGPDATVTTEPLILAVVVDLVAAVLAVLGAAGVIHLSLVQTVAWAYVGVALGLLAALVLAGIALSLVGIANP